MGFVRFLVVFFEILMVWNGKLRGKTQPPKSSPAQQSKPQRFGSSRPPGALGTATQLGVFGSLMCLWVKKTPKEKIKLSF